MRSWQNFLLLLALPLVLCIPAAHAARRPFTPITSTALYKVRDLDHDTIPDFVVLESINRDGRAFALREIRFISGRTSSVLTAFAPERDNLKNPRAFGLGDVDADGFDDVAIVSENRSANKSDIFYIYSGRTGTIIPRTLDIGKKGISVLSVSWLNDINGDGADEFVVGTAQERPEVRSLHLLSGLTGTAIKRINVKKAEQGFAQTMATIDDLNGDGTPEIVIGGTPRVKAKNGAFAVLSGRDLSLIFDQLGRKDYYFGDDVLAGVDLNRDGKREFVVSELKRTPKNNPSQWGHTFYVYSGLGLQRLYSVSIFERFTRLNSRVVDFVSDINRDCVPDMVVAADDGTLRIYSGSNGAFESNVANATTYGTIGAGMGVPHSYLLEVNTGGTIKTLDLEPIFYPPPFVAPSCPYTADRYLMD